jgi:hypothetical protein
MLAHPSRAARLLPFQAILAVSGVLTAAGVAGLLTVWGLPPRLSLVGGLAVGYPAVSGLLAPLGVDPTPAMPAVGRLVRSLLVLVAVSAAAGVVTTLLVAEVGTAAPGVGATLAAGATVGAGRLTSTALAVRGPA